MFLLASLHHRFMLEQDYFLAGRMEGCLAQGAEKRREDKDFIS